MATPAPGPRPPLYLTTSVRRNPAQPVRLMTLTTTPRGRPRRARLAWRAPSSTPSATTPCSAPSCDESSSPTRAPAGMPTDEPVNPWQVSAHGPSIGLHFQMTGGWEGQLAGTGRQPLISNPAATARRAARHAAARPVQARGGHPGADHDHALDPGLLVRGRAGAILVPGGKRMRPWGT